MRSYFIAGNWKMNKTIAESTAVAKDFVAAFKGVEHRVMVAAPFTALHAVSEVVKGSNVELGAQNMASVESGAHTGEVSVLMLKELGVTNVILGHSERRAIYGESDALINTKVKLALQHGLTAILCVGETLEEREAGKAEAVVNQQLTDGLAGISEAELKNVVIAYEPVWAIGTGKTATPEDADAIHKSARETLESLYTKAAADAMIIQYGGSVKPANATQLMGMENIDGALVGGASLTVENFEPIVKFDK